MTEAYDMLDTLPEDEFEELAVKALEVVVSLASFLAEELPADHPSLRDVGEIVRAAQKAAARSYAQGTQPIVPVGLAAT